MTVSQQLSSSERQAIRAGWLLWERGVVSVDFVGRHANTRCPRWQHQLQMAE